MMIKKNTRTRNWTFIFYPESAPANWQEIIDGWHVPYLISPKHDKDLNPDGTPKKEHFHVLLMFQGIKSYEQIVELIEPLNGPIPQVCQSSKGMARYLCHLDNPSKFQYKVEDIIAGGGADVAELLKPSASDRYTMIREMINFIFDNEILEFEEIVIFAMENKFDTWFPLLCDNSAYIISNVIASKRNRLKDSGEILSGKNLIDKYTGEILADKSFLFSHKEEKNEDENEEI